MSDAATCHRRRWDRLQAGFVDGPVEAVRQADALVTELMVAATDPLAAERCDLERRWNRSDASTEELRAALVHYRSILDRLLARPGPSVSGLDIDGTDEVLAGDEAADVLLHS